MYLTLRFGLVDLKLFLATEVSGSEHTSFTAPQPKGVNTLHHRASDAVTQLYRLVGERSTRMFHWQMPQCFASASKAASSVFLCFFLKKKNLFQSSVLHSNLT